MDYDERMVEAVRSCGIVGAFSFQVSEAVGVHIVEIRENLESAITAGLLEHDRRLQPNGLMGDWWRYIVKPTEQPIPAMSAAEVAAVDKEPVRAHMTKAETAIACIKDKGRASNADLRKAMELHGSQHATHYLRAQINRKQIHLDEEGYWRMGANPAELPIPRSELTTSPQKATTETIPLTLATFNNLNQPEPGPEPVIAPEEVIMDEIMPEPSPEKEITKESENTIPVFSCALWSDGEFQMMRDGEPIALLSLKEFSILCSYLGNSPWHKAFKLEEVPA